MITILYFWKTTQDAYDPDTDAYVGQDTIKQGIKETTVATEEELENVLEDMAVSEGESEGHEHYKTLAIFDKETGWYRKVEQ